MDPKQKSPWLAWAAGVLPAFAMALTWPLTESLPFVNRVLVGVAVALVIFAVLYFMTNARGRDGGT
jgi:hypothetical protein